MRFADQFACSLPVSLLGLRHVPFGSSDAQSAANLPGKEMRKMESRSVRSCGAGACLPEAFPALTAGSRPPLRARIPRQATTAAMGASAGPGNGREGLHRGGTAGAQMTLALRWAADA
jgi:hypothetical protein